MPSFEPLDIIGPQPGAIRRALCELTGGHSFDEQSTFYAGGPWSYRLRCSRCGFMTKWRSAQHKEIPNATS